MTWGRGLGKGQSFGQLVSFATGVGFNLINLVLIGFLVSRLTKERQPSGRVLVPVAA